MLKDLEEEKGEKQSGIQLKTVMETEYRDVEETQARRHTHSFFQQIS